MKIEKINKNKYKVSYTLYGIKTKEFEVFVDKEKYYINFPNYNPIYYLDTGEKVDLYKGFKIQDKINSLKRLQEWKS